MKNISHSLAGAEGHKIYVHVTAFQDPVDDDVAAAYAIPPNSLVDKCLCLLSHWPFHRGLKQAVEKIHHICFTNPGATPVWETVTDLIDRLPFPAPLEGGRVSFPLQDIVLIFDSPIDSMHSLPYAEVSSLCHLAFPMGRVGLKGGTWDGPMVAQLSFQPLVQCLDVENVIKVISAAALEKTILLCSSK